MSEPLPGVSVVVKGTRDGTTTDDRRRYKLKMFRKSNIVFSYVGYDSQEKEEKGRL